MKYMLLIHQGTTPTPADRGLGRLSEDEQGAVYADYKAINETPGVTPGDGMAAARDGDDRPGRRTARRSPPTARSRRSRRRSAATSSSRPTTSTRRSSSPRRIPAARMGGAIEVRPIVEW